MGITQAYLMNNDCYKAGATLSPSRLMVHSTACRGVRASNFLRSWNVGKPNGRSVCVHGFIDDTGIYQTLPFNYQAWHCGGSGNQQSIGIELCEPYDYNDIVYFNMVKANAISCYAYLCLVYGISPSNIISHAEGHRLGIASNHGDPDHWWKCVGYSMDQFRNDVQAYLNSLSSNSPSNNQGHVYIDNMHYQVGLVGDTNMLPEVRNLDDWAGVYGKPIDRLKIWLEKEGACFQCYAGGKWSKWFYSGELANFNGAGIEKIRFSANNQYITYRTHMCGQPEHQWLDFISGYGTNDNDASSYRGGYGMYIDGLQACVKYR